MPSISENRRLEQERERRTVFQILYGISRIDFSVGQREFLDLGLGAEIHLLQIEPEEVGSKGGFKVIYLIFLIGYRASARGRDVRLVGRSDSERYGYVTHHTQYAGDCNRRVCCLRDGMNVE